MIVSIGWHNDVLEYLKIFHYTFCGYIDTGVYFNATSPSPMIVNMQISGFLKAIQNLILLRVYIGSF